MKNQQIQTKCSLPDGTKPMLSSWLLSRARSSSAGTNSCCWILDCGSANVIEIFSIGFLIVILLSWCIKIKLEHEWFDLLVRSFSLLLCWEPSPTSLINKVFWSLMLRNCTFVVLRNSTVIWDRKVLDGWPCWCWISLVDILDQAVYVWLG